MQSVPSLENQLRSVLGFGCRSFCRSMKADIQYWISCWVPANACPMMCELERKRSLLKPDLRVTGNRTFRSFKDQSQLKPPQSLFLIEQHVWQKHLHPSGRPFDHSSVGWVLVSLVSIEHRLSAACQRNMPVLSFQTLCLLDCQTMVSSASRLGLTRRCHGQGNVDLCKRNGHIRHDFEYCL